MNRLMIVIILSSLLVTVSIASQEFDNYEEYEKYIEESYGPFYWDDVKEYYDLWYVFYEDDPDNAEDAERFDYYITMSIFCDGNPKYFWFWTEYLDIVLNKTYWDHGQVDIIGCAFDINESNEDILKFSEISYTGDEEYYREVFIPADRIKYLSYYLLPEYILDEKYYNNLYDKILDRIWENLHNDYWEFCRKDYWQSIENKNSLQRVKSNSLFSTQTDSYLFQPEEKEIEKIKVEDFEDVEKLWLSIQTD